MTATITSQLQHRWFLVLRIALFALGEIFILGALITGAYQVGPDTHYTDIITSGLTGGIPLLILGFLSDAVTRRRFGWALLVLAMVGVVSPFIGFGLIFGPGGGNQNTTAGGIGFLVVLCGFPLFLLAFVWSVLLGIDTIISDRRGRQIQGGASAPTSRP